MLIIKMNKKGIGKNEYAWHVGQSSPQGLNLELIEKIQADGDELKYILDNFANLPVAKHRHAITWEGVIARFIVSHL